MNFNKNIIFEEGWTVKEWFYYGVKYRLYNETTAGFDFCFYNETTHKWHELVEKYNFDIYYIKTSPQTNFKIFLNENTSIDIFNEDIKQIKFLQGNDLYYLYMNIFFEVLYFLPHIDTNNNYSYSLIFFVKKNFDINKISKHNFNLVNIDFIKKIKIEDVNFKFIKNIFETRTFINNSTPEIGEYNYDDWNKNLKLSFNEYLDKYCFDTKNTNNGYARATRLNESSKIRNYNLIAQSVSKLLCTHIWSFDLEYFIKKDNSYNIHFPDENYGINCVFLTNYGELIGAVQVNNIGGEDSFKKISVWPSSLCDSTSSYGISIYSFSKEFVLNGFIDFSNLKKKDWHFTQEE